MTAALLAVTAGTNVSNAQSVPCDGCVSYMNIYVSPSVSTSSVKVEGDPMSFSVKIPPVGVFYDWALARFNKGRRIGWGVQCDYSEFSFRLKTDPSVRGGVSRVAAQTGITYHLPLGRQNRIQLYAKGLVGLGIYNQTGDDSDAAEIKNQTFVYTASAGLRCFVSKKVGFFVEGGQSTGYVSTGMSFRW